MNLYVINDCMVVPFTLRFRCSFVELVAEGPQLPRWFVSHWWGTPFCQTVSLLAFHGEQRQLSEASPYWICTFANNQHDLSSLSGTLRQTPFVRAILSEDCVGTLALLDSSVTTFDRIWCVLENFVSTVWAREAGEYLYDIAAWLPVGSALHGGRPVPAKPTLRLDFGRSQAREVVEDEATGGAFPLQVAARGACVNISLAKASREEDKRKILHLIAGTAEEDWAQPPPEECEAFDSMNGRVRRSMFAAGALYRAALQNDAAELKRLLVEFPDAKDEGISDGASPVYAAAMKDHTEVLEALLDARANADTTKDDGASAAFIATQFGSPKALNLLLGASADPNRARQEDGVAPAYMAVQSGHSEELKMLLEARASPNQLTIKGASPLHLAAQLGKPELVSLLLELEADPNLASAQGQTALSLASNKKVISILQEAGAKIEVAQPQAEPSSGSAASPKKPAAKGKAKAKAFATTFASAQASLSNQIGMFSDYAALE